MARDNKPDFVKKNFWELRLKDFSGSNSKNTKPKPNIKIFIISLIISVVLVYYTKYYINFKFLFFFLDKEALIASFLINVLIWAVFVYAIIILLLGKIKLKNLFGGK